MVMILVLVHVREKKGGNFNTPPTVISQSSCVQLNPINTSVLCFF